MKTKKPNAALVCKQFEDLLAPRLHLSAVERAVCSHLFRHTRLEGKSSLRFSMRWLACDLCLGQNSVRKALRRLVRKGVLKLLERSKAGHVVHVHLPGESSTPTATGSPAASKATPRRASVPPPNFLRWLYRQGRLTSAELSEGPSRPQAPRRRQAPA